MDGDGATLIDFQERRVQHRARVVLRLLERGPRGGWSRALERSVSTAMGELDRAARCLAHDHVLRAVALDLVVAYTRWLTSTPGSTIAHDAADACWQREIRLRNELRHRVDGGA